MVRTAFHDCYVPLAVLNTILSTGLSCYSRYPAAVLPRGGGGCSVEGTLRSLGLGSRPALRAPIRTFEGIHTWLNTLPSLS